MQLTSLIRPFAIIAVCFTAAHQTGAAQAKKIPTLVEVWRRGDDGFTTRLRDALENAFESSPDFLMSYGKKPGTLVVTIPDHVEWERIGKRTRVIYVVEFTSVDNKKLGSSKGSCWDDRLAKCATRIIKDAKITARKMRRGSQ